MKVTVWWIGSGPANPVLLDGVKRALECELRAPVNVRLEIEHPSGTFDPRRNQHSSSEILRWLSARLPEGGGKMLGLTDVDLFIPILTFVFGEAQLGGRTAVASTARLGDGELPHDPRRLGARLEREALHEVGHTFGLVHCDEPRCVMARAAGLREVDEKKAQFCEFCRIGIEGVLRLKRIGDIRNDVKQGANHES